MKQSDYRKYISRKVEGNDDFGCMGEVVTRRYSKDTPRPDLILVDGGLGQLHAAAGALEELGIIN